MKKHILPEFQEYLRSKSLVRDKYIRFHTNRARKKAGEARKDVTRGLL